jgi:hypothetical protein
MKSRLYGFHDMVDSEAMFVRLLGRFRTQSTAWLDERITVKKPVNLVLDR